MIKKMAFVALVGGTLFQFGSCWGGNTFLWTSILNELLFS